MRFARSAVVAYRLRVVVRVAIVGALIGMAYGTWATQRLGTGPLARGFLAGAAISGGLGLLDSLLPLTRFGRWAAGLPFAATIALRTALWIAWIVPVLATVRFVLPFSPLDAWHGFVTDVGFALVASLVVVTVLTLARFLGPGVAGHLLAGRYHRPRIEERAFLLLDIVGSSAIAARLGDDRFLALLRQVVQDVTEDILAHGGRIYRYLGDAILVSWPLEAAVRDARILRCLAAIGARLREREAAYRAQFGEAVAGRASLHAGPVAVGEIGDAYREIMFLGTALNVTARIETAARARDARAVISAALLDRIRPRPDDRRFVPIDHAPFVGEETAGQLYAIEAAPAA